MLSGYSYDPMPHKSLRFLLSLLLLQLKRAGFAVVHTRMNGKYR